MKGLAVSRPLPCTEALQVSLKDRFNYASFSCAALVLSSSKHTRYTSAVLNNDSDQYMLAKCPPATQLYSLQSTELYLEEEEEHAGPSDPSFRRQRDHFNLLTSNFLDSIFLMIELCSDIKIDTVVISNNEYFSSKFRHFSLWVSTHYPPKHPTRTTSDDEFASWIDEETDNFLCRDASPLEHSRPSSKILYKNGWRLIGFFEASNVRGPQVQ
jgi:hypothetical protein